MRSAMERGLWVFFQNCHLAPSWMPTLERLIEQIDADKVLLHNYCTIKGCLLDKLFTLGNGIPHH
jgi:hypothetical protein